MKSKIIAAATVAVAAITLTVVPASADHSINVTNNGVCHETNGNPRLNNTSSNWNASAEGQDRARAANSVQQFLQIGAIEQLGLLGHLPDV